MTVGELIARLQTYAPETPVFEADYNGSYMEYMPLRAGITRRRTLYQYGDTWVSNPLIFRRSLDDTRGFPPEQTVKAVVFL